MKGWLVNEANESLHNDGVRFQDTPKSVMGTAYDRRRRRKGTGLGQLARP
jgi:hypothetical protein